MPQALQGVSQLSPFWGAVSEPPLLPSNRPCFQLWVGGALRGAPFLHLPSNDSGRCGPGASPSCISAPGSLMGRLSFSFIFLLTHQGKFGTTQGEVGAQPGAHFAGRGRSHGAERWVCRSSPALAGADRATWELTQSLPVAPASWLSTVSDNSQRAVSGLIVCALSIDTASQPGISVTARFVSGIRASLSGLTGALALQT